LLLTSLLSPRCRGALSILAKTPAEFETGVPSLYLDIATDGTILYDPRGYAEERLAFLRRRIEEAGLFRVRTAAGDVWEWRDPPSGPWRLEWSA
jgi:hypothetical protein